MDPDNERVNWSLVLHVEATNELSEVRDKPKIRPIKLIAHGDPIEFMNKRAAV